MADDKIKPALTVEEWREFLHSERKTPLPADQIAAYMDASGASEEEARQAFLHDAAVYLYLAGQVFTRRHVEALRQAANDAEWEARPYTDKGRAEAREPFDDLAAIIESPAATGGLTHSATPPLAKCEGM